MALPAYPLTAQEWAIIQHLRSVQAQSPNFKLTVYGQGSATRRILDIEPAPRIRLTTTELLHPALDD